MADKELMDCPVCKQSEVVSYGREYPKRRWLQNLTDPSSYKPMYKCPWCHYRWLGDETLLERKP